MPRASSLDDLTRSLAEPLPRRRAVGRIGATVGSLALGGLWPGRAGAQDCLAGNTPCCGSCCYPGEDCVCDGLHTCRRRPDPCPAGTTTCQGVDAYTRSCCESGRECVDMVCVPKCPSGTTKCGQSCCKSDQQCQNGTCVRGCPGGGDRCGSSRLCCTPDQVCDTRRGVCCPPSGDTCLSPERTCAERVERDVAEYMTKYCQSTNRAGNVSKVSSDAAAELGCYTTAQTTIRYLGTRSPAGAIGGLNDCPKVRDPSKCGSAGCDGNDRCRRCSSAGAAVTEMRATGFAEALVDEPVANAAATKASVRAIRRKLKQSNGRMQRHATRVRSLSLASTPEYRQASLYRELVAYRRSVLSVRASIVRMQPKDRRGRTARRATIEALDAFAEQLELFATGVGTSQVSKAVAAGRRARSAERRTARTAAAARRALGCGRHCR